MRAFNVLRQYDVDDVVSAWETVAARLAPSGLFIEGTCDELGRRAAWLLIDATARPRTLTLAWAPDDVDQPSDVAERLPKALIHRNIPGEPIHELLAAADDAWERSSGWAPHGPRIRWRHARQLLIDAGWPLEPVRRRIRDNTLTVDWSAVAPSS